ncbi:MAG: FAD-dependent oxidoreductase, partial [Elusimicrobiota bacterium]
MSVQNYDVIITGAGSIGTPLAMFLAEKKLKTLVIEALPSVGQGQNKCAIGGVRATHSDASKIKACLRSLDI